MRRARPALRAGHRELAITQPSLPNYLALTSGTTGGISSDCTGCHLGAPNIVDQLEVRASPGRRTSRAACPVLPRRPHRRLREEAQPLHLLRRHRELAGALSHLVGFDKLSADLRTGRLPSYLWISPNLCDDGHDCGLQAGERVTLPDRPGAAPRARPHGILVLTWDEGLSDEGCCAGQARGGHIATVVAGAGVTRAARESAPSTTTACSAPSSTHSGWRRWAGRRRRPAGGSRR